MIVSKARGPEYRESDNLIDGRHLPLLPRLWQPKRRQRRRQRRCERFCFSFSPTFFDDARSALFAFFFLFFVHNPYTQQAWNHDIYKSTMLAAVDKKRKEYFRTLVVVVVIVIVRKIQSNTYTHTRSHIDIYLCLFWLWHVHTWENEKKSQIFFRSLTPFSLPPSLDQVKPMWYTLKAGMQISRWLIVVLIVLLFYQVSHQPWSSRYSVHDT